MLLEIDEKDEQTYRTHRGFSVCFSVLFIRLFSIQNSSHFHTIRVAEIDGKDEHTYRTHSGVSVCSNQRKTRPLLIGFSCFPMGL